MSKTDGIQFWQQVYSQKKKAVETTYSWISSTAFDSW